MRLKLSIITVLTIIIFLTTGFISVMAEFNTGEVQTESELPASPGLEVLPKTERMPVVMLPEYNDEDLNYNRIEDKFEPMLAEKKDDEIVEAIIRTEFRIGDDFENYIKSTGAEVVYTTHGVESLGVRVAKSTLLRLAKSPLIARIYANHEMIRTLDTSVPVINAGSAKLTAAGYPDLDGTGVTIAVIDSGIDGDHRTFPDGKIVAFKDFNGGHDDLDPTNGMNTYDSTNVPHGTMVSSSAAGTGGGAKYVGSAPGAYLAVIRVGGSSFDVSQAVQWCINNQDKDFNKDGIADGPDLITMSLGTSPNSYMDQICVQAVTAGLTFLTSAGNSGPGSSTVTSPARAKEIIAVGGVHDNKNIWSSSSRGPGANGITKPDICAPGVQITVAYPGNNWIVTSGTSFSSPIAAGGVALMYQLRPDLTPSEVMTILHNTAEDRGATGPDNAYGWGVMDTTAALDSLPTIRELKISQTTAEEDDEISFSAITTGKIVKYEWDFDGDGTYDYSSYSSSTTTHTYTKSGFYEVSFKITDAKDESQEKSELVIIENVNPELDVVYTSGSLNEDEKLYFNVSGTYDTSTDYSNLAYSWDFGDGTLLDTVETEISHTYTNQGTYNVLVSVQDDDGAKDSDSIQIIVSNILPVADAGSLTRSGNEDDRLLFSGVNSYDTSSDYPKLNYTWDMGDGTISYLKEFYHTYTESKTYSISLLVRDDNGGTDNKIIRATINNVKPSVHIKEQDERRMLIKEDEKFTLHGIVNDTISDLDSLEYHWDFDDGKENGWDTDNLITEHSFLKDGTYNIKLRVRDDDGAVNFTSLAIDVENVPPVAEYIPSSVSIWEDEIVYFDAGGTTDTVNDLISLQYSWDFNDGDTAMGKNVQHIFRRAGIFQVVLTVTDDDNEKSIFTEYITVRNVEPKATLSVNREIAYVGEMINFSGKSSWDSPSDYNGLVYQWDFGDMNSDKGMEVQHAYTAAGDYEAVLTVIDDDGSFQTASITLVIKERSKNGAVDDVFNIQSTEGKLSIFAVALILVLVLIIALIVVSDRKRRAAKQKRIAYPPGIYPGKTRKRRSKKQTPPADFNQLVQQQQMADYGYAHGIGHYPAQYPVNFNLPQNPQQYGYNQEQQGDYNFYDYSTQPQQPLPQQNQPALPPFHPLGTEVGSGSMETSVYGEVVSGIPVQDTPVQPPYDAEILSVPDISTGPQNVAKTSEPETDGQHKFCNSCGEEVKFNWFVCPNCKNIL